MILSAQSSSRRNRLFHQETSKLRELIWVPIFKKLFLNWVPHKSSKEAMRQQAASSFAIDQTGLRDGQRHISFSNLVRWVQLHIYSTRSVTGMAVISARIQRSI